MKQRNIVLLESVKMQIKENREATNNASAEELSNYSKTICRVREEAPREFIYTRKKFAVRLEYRRLK
jgi:hypothetical protein